MNFRYRFMQFMSGRYGADDLFYTLLFTAMAISVINIFFRTMILQLIVYIFIVFALWRALSRNIERRRKENCWFKDKISFIKKKKEFYNQRKADSFHIYRKCPKCKAVLRLPHRVGTHTTVCPRCSKSFKVKVRK